MPRAESRRYQTQSSSLSSPPWGLDSMTFRLWIIMIFMEDCQWEELTYSLGVQAFWGVPSLSAGYCPCGWSVFRSSRDHIDITWPKVPTLNHVGTILLSNGCRPNKTDHSYQTRYSKEQRWLASSPRLRSDFPLGKLNYFQHKCLTGLKFSQRGGPLNLCGA